MENIAAARAVLSMCCDQCTINDILRPLRLGCRHLHLHRAPSSHTAAPPGMQMLMHQPRHHVTDTDATPLQTLHSHLLDPSQPGRMTAGCRSQLKEGGAVCMRAPLPERSGCFVSSHAKPSFAYWLATSSMPAGRSSWPATRGLARGSWFLQQGGKLEEHSADLLRGRETHAGAAQPVPLRSHLHERKGDLFNQARPAPARRRDPCRRGAARAAALRNDRR